MEEKFRIANSYEQRVALNCMQQFRDDKKEHYMLNALIYGVLFAFGMLAICGLVYKEKSDEIKRFTGERPQFENYENKILDEVYEHVSTSNETYYNINTTNLYQIPSTNGGYYRIVKQPSEIDFDKFEYFDKNKKNAYISGYSGKGKYVNAPEYSRIVKEAKQYFDENIDARIRRTRSATAFIWLAFLGLVVGYIFFVCVLGLKSYMQLQNTRVKLVEDGDFSIIKAKMIGREEHSHAKSRTTYNIEVQFEDGETLKQEVKENQYDKFEAGNQCFVVKLKDEYGFYDEYDIVWEELCGVETIF